MRLLQLVRCILLVLFMVFTTDVVYTQSFNQPWHGLKSHETLIIKDIGLSPEKTVISFSLENRIDGGNFCADKNIYVIDPEGEKLKLTKSTGIPQCPEYYKFKSIGEKLQFVLEFPPLKKGVKWIDIVEDCTENCFSFYGVTLNPGLNVKINEALFLAEKGETADAVSQYKNIIEGLTDEDSGVKGGIYTDIITLLLELGDKKAAEEWYKKLADSESPRLDLYIKNLNSRGIRY